MINNVIVWSFLVQLPITFGAILNILSTKESDLYCYFVILPSILTW